MSDVTFVLPGQPLAAAAAWPPPAFSSRTLLQEKWSS